MCDLVVARLIEQSYSIYTVYICMYVHSGLPYEIINNYSQYNIQYVVSRGKSDSKQAIRHINFIHAVNLL